MKKEKKEKIDWREKYIEEFYENISLGDVLSDIYKVAKSKAINPKKALGRIRLILKLWNKGLFIDDIDDKEENRG